MTRFVFSREYRRFKLLNDEKRKMLSGQLIFWAMILSVAGLIVYPPATIASGSLYFINSALLWKQINSRSRLLIKIIVLASTPGLCLAFSAGEWNVFSDVFSSNAPIISLLIAVSAYSLVKERLSDNKSHAPNKAGVSAFFQLFFGLHLLGAIINYAAALFYGDRLKTKNGLSLENAVLVSRCFGSAGFWSPLFVTMAVAFSYSPNANYLSVIKYSLLMAIVSFVYCLLQFMVNPASAKFTGITLSLSDFSMPISMAALILMLVVFFPKLNVIGVVISICFFFCLCKYIIDKRTGARATLTNGYSGFPSECGIFLAASALNSSLLHIVHDFQTHVSAIVLSPEALAIFLPISIALTCIGIHPLISISVFVAIIKITPGLENALAFSLVVSWTIGSSLGPLSGQNLGLASRYGVDSKSIAKANVPYSVLLCSLAITLLLAVSHW